MLFELSCTFHWSCDFLGNLEKFSVPLASNVTEGKGGQKAIDEEEKQYGGNESKGNGGGAHADSNHRTILRNYRSKIVKDLEPNNILPDLVSVLTVKDDTEIKAQSTRQGRCEQLLEILPRKGPNAFKAFVEALKEEAPYLASDLIDAGNNRLWGIEVSIKWHKEGLSFQPNAILAEYSF